MVTTFVPVKGDGVKESIRKVIFTTAVICFIYFGSTLGVDLFNEWRAAMIQRRLEIDKSREVDLNDSRFDNIRDLNPQYYLALWAQNNDMVGYIKIGDTKVNYPVLQTDNNRFYLDYDFDKNESKGGAIFADYRNRFDPYEISDNTILYGHNIATGNYFAALSNYHTLGTRFNDLEFYRTYPTIQFDTLYEKMEWKIFACVLFNTKEEHGEVYNYWRQLEFEDENHFNTYILDVMDRSVMLTDVDIEYGDQILTLSTCFWPYGEAVDARCVIFARRVRDGEDSNVDVSKASINQGVFRFDTERNRMGNKWHGRNPGGRVNENNPETWDYEKYLKSYNP